jgi:hypothetical protein
MSISSRRGICRAGGVVLSGLCLAPAAPAQQGDGRQLVAPVE